MGVAEFLAAAARDGLVPWSAELEAAGRYGASAREIEAAALGAGLLPARYARNAGTFGVAGQAALHASSVAVAGCGGLGGYLVELFARLGVGTILAVDPDAFDESNLNRQLLATIETLGRSKAEAAARRMRSVNPAVEPVPVAARLDSRNARSILGGVDLVADGLDSVPARLELAEACSGLGIPFVHASVAGWYGQATTLRPGSTALRGLFARAKADRGAETALGTPAFAPAFAAALEAAEACKVLLGLGGTLDSRLLAFDLLAMETAEFMLEDLRGNRSAL